MQPPAAWRFFLFAEAALTAARFFPNCNPASRCSPCALPWRPSSEYLQEAAPIAAGLHGDGDQQDPNRCDLPGQLEHQEQDQERDEVEGIQERHVAIDDMERKLE